MPGPGPHAMYALGVGEALMRLSNEGFGPHHCLFYAANAFRRSFAQWLTATLGLGRRLGSFAMDLLHYPFYYPLLLGAPLAVLYSSLSVAVESATAPPGLR